ncbi:MAG: hypothetical protein V3W45_02485, partial [Sedimentisphaerales bacterium]
MKKQVLLCFYCVFMLVTRAPASDYECEHFTINSDLDPRFVQFIEANAEAYFKNLKSLYFLRSWQEPLLIYYSKTQSNTRELLSKHGHKAEVDYGRYIYKVPAIYTHLFM